MECNFCKEDAFSDERRIKGDQGYYGTDDHREACARCVVHVCLECGGFTRFVASGFYDDAPIGNYQCSTHGKVFDQLTH